MPVYFRGIGVQCSLLSMSLFKHGSFRKWKRKVRTMKFLNHSTFHIHLPPPTRGTPSIIAFCISSLSLPLYLSSPPPCLLLPPLLLLSLVSLSPSLIVIPRSPPPPPPPPHFPPCHTDAISIANIKVRMFSWLSSKLVHSHLDKLSNQNSEKYEIHLNMKSVMDIKKT